MPSQKDTALFKSLLKLLKEQTETLGQRLSNEQLSNLTYGFRKVLPRNPDELSVVIALGLQQKPTHAVIKEYLRMRRKKNNVFIPYHKVRHAQKILSKSWGVLLYKEQAEKILEELTATAYGDLPATIFLDVDVLIDCLKKDYRKRLSEKEIEKISKDLRRFTKFFMNYSWCRAIADKALELTKQEKDKSSEIS